MIVSFGKHQGKSVELLVLQEPGYIDWILNQSDIKKEFEQIQSEALWLISIFNNKPFNEQCEGKCGKPSVRYTVNNGNILNPHWWCDNCNPYRLGAIRGKLHTIKTYQQALQHVKDHCQGRSSEYRHIIRKVARAKGLPRHLGEQEAQGFFSILL